jgi:hemerythrin-like metal-binding protein
MYKLEWKEEYSVGVKLFDDQHKNLLSYLNKIFGIFNDSGSKEEVEKLLEDLEQYAMTHFKTEEEVFDKYKYYGSEFHNQEHRLYESKINDFRAKFHASDEKVNTEVLEFLADWLMGHIQGTDKEYKRFLNNNGVF